MATVSNFNVVAFVSTCKANAEMAPSFANVEEGHVVAAFELMLNQHQHSGRRVDIDTSEITGQLAGNSSIEPMAAAQAASVARVLFAAYLNQVEGSVSYETVPLLVDLDYYHESAGAGLAMSKVKGFRIFWLKKPVDAMSLKNGICDILENSGYILEYNRYDAYVTVSVGGATGLLDEAGMIAVINDILGNKGYEYTLINRDATGIAINAALRSE